MGVRAGILNHPIHLILGRVNFFIVKYICLNPGLKQFIAHGEEKPHSG
jgi:hypothetical protein